MPCLEELAHHSCEAAALGDVAGALRWSRAAAQAAFDRLAYEEAASHYERALNVLDPDDSEQCADRADLRVELARALRAVRFERERLARPRWQPPTRLAPRYARTSSSTPRS